MIHAFTIKDLHIVADVNSGAVHVVDKPVFDLLRLLEGLPPEVLDGPMPQSAAEGMAEYDPGEVAEMYRELQALKRSGELFAPDSYAALAAGVHKKPFVKALCLHVSHDCNLRCGYCFAGTGNFTGERCMMSFETGKKAIDFVVAHSGARRNIEVDFFGGEPLMNFDMVRRLTLYIREHEAGWGKNFRLTLTTNGVLLDGEKLAFINAHMSNLVLSIDGRREVNDHMRKTAGGGGSYDVILPRLKRAADSRDQDNYYVRGTFTRHNLDFAADVLHLADQGFRQISVEPVVGGADTDYAIREEDLPQIFRQYEDLAEAYLQRDGGGGWFNFFHFMIDLEQGPCVVKRMSGCGAGCEYVAVTPEGDIYPCHQFVGKEEFLLGNVHAGTYSTRLTRGFADANVYQKPRCRECWARFYCSGGCHANAHQFGGDINAPYAIGCEMEKKRVECALYIKAAQAGI